MAGRKWITGRIPVPLRFGWHLAAGAGEQRQISPQVG